jgi:hypothetical protein
MNQDIQLKYKIKQNVEKYNKDQKSLYINGYVIKIVTILILLVCLVIMCIVIFSAFTPLMMDEKSPLSNALALSFTGCVISVIILAAAIFYFKRKRASDKAKRQAVVDDSEVFIIKEQDLKTLSQEDEQMLDIKIKQSVPMSHKSGFIGRLLSVFPLAKEILLFLGSLIFNPVKKPDYIYLDQNKLDLALWIIEKTLKDKNFSIKFDLIAEKYCEYSNKWLQNSIKNLIQINVIRLVDSEEGDKIVLLNLDFHNPDTG